MIHVALAAMGAYVWGRGGLGLRPLAAWITGLCFGLGGYFTAQVEHLNQIQVLAWLPWLLWLYERKGASAIGRVVSLALVIAALALTVGLQSWLIHRRIVAGDGTNP